MHNVESHYYSFLAKQTNNWWKKLYYRLEVKKLKNHEINIKGLNGLFCLSQKDCKYFERYYENVNYLPVFLEGTFELKSNNKVEKFALYHGNLEVEENIKAVEFLHEVFRTLKWKLVIAGNSEGDHINRIIKNSSNIELEPSPSRERMHSLIESTHLHCLPTFQNTGVKLKLISSLINGKTVLVNNGMISEEYLGEFCEFAEGVEDWQSSINKLMETSIQEGEIRKRRESLLKTYDNLKNAKFLLESLAEVQ